LRITLITIAATIMVPGAFVVLLPYLILGAARTSRPIEIGLVEVLSVVLAAIGVSMVVWVSVAFVRRGKGTPVPVDPPRQFVAAGLYRFVRNPMYSGAILAILAEAAFFRSGRLLLYAAVLWLALHAFTVLLEEPQLERRFGDTYRAYKARIPRWIPRLPQP
jgi:protein-S-isoprenylcysteine O-methyltransferase Ste14